MIPTPVSFAPPRRLLFLVALVGLLALGGCVTAPFGATPAQEGPVTVVLGNSADRTYAFQVSVARGELNDGEVTIRKADGTVDSTSPGAGLTTYDFTPAFGRVTSIDMPRGRSRLAGRHVLEPGETNRRSIEEFEARDTILIVVRTDIRVVAMVTMSCRGDLVYVDVTMRAYGTETAFNCE